jgi:hypothetical protein
MEAFHPFAWAWMSTFPKKQERPSEWQSKSVSSRTELAAALEILITSAVEQSMTPPFASAGASEKGVRKGHDGLSWTC